VFAVPGGQVGAFAGSPCVKTITVRGRVHDTTVPLLATGAVQGCPSYFRPRTAPAGQDPMANKKRRNYTSRRHIAVKPGLLCKTRKACRRSASRLSMHLLRARLPNSSTILPGRYPHRRG